MLLAALPALLICPKQAAKAILTACLVRGLECGLQILHRRVGGGTGRLDGSLRRMTL